MELGGSIVADEYARLMLVRSQRGSRKFDESRATHHLHLGRLEAHLGVS